MSTISANDLKIKGIAAIESALSDRDEAIVSVRGKDRFVVMDLAHYHYLRECELEAALAQARAEVVAGKAVNESAEAHLARLDALLCAHSPRNTASPSPRATTAARPRGSKSTLIFVSSTSKHCN